jgi:hypothetical protein
MAVLDRIRLLVQPVDEALYRDFGQPAQERMSGETSMIGPSSHLPLRCTSPSGPRTRISSAAASPLGPRTASSCTCRVAMNDHCSLPEVHA